MKYLSTSWQLEVPQGISQQHHPFSLSPISPSSYVQQSVCTSAWPYSFTVNPSLWCHLCGMGERQRKHRTHLKLHDHVIKFFIPSAANKSANMILPCKGTETYRMEHNTTTLWSQLVEKWFLKRAGNHKWHQAGSFAEQINFVSTSQSHTSRQHLTFNNKTDSEKAMSGNQHQGSLNPQTDAAGHKWERD